MQIVVRIVTVLYTGVNLEIQIYLFRGFQLVVTLQKMLAPTRTRNCWVRNQLVYSSQPILRNILCFGNHNGCGIPQHKNDHFVKDNKIIQNLQKKMSHVFNVTAAELLSSVHRAETVQISF